MDRKNKGIENGIIKWRRKTRGRIIGLNICEHQFGIVANFPKFGN